MDGNIFIRNTKHLGRGGLIILSFIIEVDMISCLADAEFGLSLCGTLFNGNKSVVLNGGFIMEYAMGWVCGSVFVIALMSVFIWDTLKDILKELKKK